MWNATRHLGKILQVNRPKAVGTVSWRKSSEYYKKPDECKLRPSGCVDFSPAWFQQGHTVSLGLETVSLPNDLTTNHRLWTGPWRRQRLSKKLIQIPAVDHGQRTCMSPRLSSARCFVLCIRRSTQLVATQCNDCLPTTA